MHESTRGKSNKFDGTKPKDKEQGFKSTKSCSFAHPPLRVMRDDDNPGRVAEDILPLTVGKLRFKQLVQHLAAPSTTPSSLNSEEASGRATEGGWKLGGREEGRKEGREVCRESCGAI